MTLTTAPRSLMHRNKARTRTINILLALACFATTVLAIAGGEYDISPMKVVHILFGGGQGLETTIVWDWRMPRAVAALLFGAALAISGLIFQTLTRNPLGSPDIIGLSTGAYSGALVAITLLGGGFLATTAGALIGGLLTAIVVYFLAWRGGTHGFRLILVGIGISSVLSSLNSYMVLQADLDVAMSAAVWGAGTLNGLKWVGVIPVGIVVVAFSAGIMLMTRSLQILQMGDDVSTMLGMRTERTKMTLVILAVLLTSAVTALVGPIAFVALVAPQLAKRLVGGSSLNIGASALFGALLLSLGDLLAQRMFAPIQLPVGVVTVCIGGVYLVYLLNKGTRRIRG